MFIPYARRLGRWSPRPLTAGLIASAWWLLLVVGGSLAGPGERVFQQRATFAATEYGVQQRTQARFRRDRVDMRIAVDPPRFLDDLS